MSFSNARQCPHSSLPARARRKAATIRRVIESMTGSRLAPSSGSMNNNILGSFEIITRAELHGAGEGARTLDT